MNLRRHPTRDEQSLCVVERRAEVPCRSVQTRYLILAALLTALAILIAAAVWFVTTFA
jgi:hypothetical protein